MVTKIIKNAAIMVFREILSNKEFQSQSIEKIRSIFDQMQEMAGRVNLHSSEKATEIALNTCIRKDEDSQTMVAAFVTGLYLQHRIERAAQVGGSLLQRFGKSWFPYVLDKEKRFALEVDKELEKYLYNEIRNKAGQAGSQES